MLGTEEERPAGIAVTLSCCIAVQVPGFDGSTSHLASSRSSYNTNIRTAPSA
jgi:hypothetical protein